MRRSDLDSPLWPCTLLLWDSGPSSPCGTPVHTLHQKLSSNYSIIFCHKDWVDFIFQIQVCAGDWLPTSVFGYLHALCAYLRMIYVAFYLVFLSGVEYDVIFCDQVSYAARGQTSWLSDLHILALLSCVACKVMVTLSISLVVWLLCIVSRPSTTPGSLIKIMTLLH